MTKNKKGLDFNSLRNINKTSISSRNEEALLEEVEMSLETIDKIKELKRMDKISPESVNDFKQALINDEILSLDNRVVLIKWIENKFWSNFSSTVIKTKDFNQDNDIDKNLYLNMKNESIFFAELSQRSFLQMAIRLKIIRDNKLYKIFDLFNTFEDFIDKEIPVHRSTVFTYLDVINSFGIDMLLTTSNIDFNYTKIRPFLPLLKNKEIEETNKNDLKVSILKWSNEYSTRDMQKLAEKEKIKYGFQQKSRNVTTFSVKNIEKYINENKDKIFKINRNELNNHISFIENYLMSLKSMEGNMNSS